MNLRFYAFDKSEPFYNSTVSDGVIGLKPMYKFTEHPEYTLFYQLFSQDLIHEKVFSMYLSDKPNDNSTFIQLGGWDQKYIADGEELKMIGTSF